ncbi:dihydroorotate dehydrogenase-like protein [Saccharicrinis aurantiacus]|uniref:dihydroorotate dehydrogenase-like protein n=1 Tax=Saccharicrinis aurantiacus TaxID=1849719 RepID=UPI00248FF659|nr:dihydroorotate dehydrogenase-like protein [Saccharicrinis aurantiacus]
MPNLSVDYLGLKLKSPIIASSSGLTNSVDDIKELEKQGAGAIVLKSLFEEEIIKEFEHTMRKNQTSHYIYPETLEFYENQNVEDTLSAYLKLISDCKKTVDIPIIASINAITAETWPYFARSLQDAGADAIELNIFIQPSDTMSHDGDTDIYYKIIDAVKKEVTIPISIKISPYFTNITKTVTALSDTGIKGLVLFNRFYSPDIDINELTITSAPKFSSQVDYTLPLRWIGILSDRVNCDISASTGVHNSETLIKMLLAGAKTVQLASVLYKSGFSQISIMLDELMTWMNSKGFSNLEDVCGVLSQSKTENPAVYMRVQFMKHFADK